MKDEKVPVSHVRSYILKLHPVRWSIDQLRAFDERCRLSEPGRVPERPDLPPRLITCTGAAIEAFEGWSLKEQGSHREFILSPSSSCHPGQYRSAYRAIGCCRGKDPPHRRQMTSGRAPGRAPISRVQDRRLVLPLSEEARGTQVRP